MGNRAFITSPGARIGIYLHWNGGRDSVEAFLRWAEMANLPGLDSEGRGVAPLVTVISNFFGNDGHSILIDSVDPAHPSYDSADDNGVYLVTGHTITGRIDAPDVEQHRYDLDESLREIDQAQPEKDRLGAYLDGIETPVANLKAGDRVWVQNFRSEGRYMIRTVEGFGTDQPVNGYPRPGQPYVNRFENQDNSKNPNSYLTQDIVRIVA